MTFALCSSSVTAYFVSPVTGLTATKKNHGPSAGLAAASMLFVPGLLIGPGGSPGWMRVL